MTAPTGVRALHRWARQIGFLPSTGLRRCLVRADALEGGVSPPSAHTSTISWSLTVKGHLAFPHVVDGAYLGKAHVLAPGAGRARAACQMISTVSVGLRPASATFRSRGRTPSRPAGGLAQDVAEANCRGGRPNGRRRRRPLRPWCCRCRRRRVTAQSPSKLEVRGNRAMGNLRVFGCPAHVGAGGHWGGLSRPCGFRAGRGRDLGPGVLWASSPISPGARFM